MRRLQHISDEAESADDQKVWKEPSRKVPESCFVETTVPQKGTVITQTLVILDFLKRPTHPTSLPHTPNLVTTMIMPLSYMVGTLYDCYTTYLPSNEPLVSMFIEHKWSNNWPFYTPLNSGLNFIVKDKQGDKAGKLLIENTNLTEQILVKPVDYQDGRTQKVSLMVDCLFKYS